MTAVRKSFSINCKGRLIDLNSPRIMGIINITPDSFYDGGKNLSIDSAVDTATQMLSQGAAFIDIGGYSSRPGADDISPTEEAERVLPVIEAVLKKHPEALISIDTYRSEVAKQAISAGAAIINDISGLNFDPDIGKSVAEHNAAIVLMHTPGRPDVMQNMTDYESILNEVIYSLRESISKAESYGVNFENIIIDPGIGFGKTVEQNLEIIRELSKLLILKRPILIGTSRKSFIGKLLDNAEVGNRVEGTAATVTASIINGASIIRVHDVGEMKKIAKITDAIYSEN